MSSNQQGGHINPNLPGSYQPVMNQENFNAPAHHLSTHQQEQVAELAEASAGHIHSGSNDQSIGGNSSSRGFGSGSLDNTNNTNIADTLGSTGGAQRGHLGQYEYRENQLDEPRDRLGRDSEFGSTGRSGGVSGTGDGTRQAAGMGVGGGLAATAASQGLGSHGQQRGIEDQRLGGLVGDSSSYGSSGHTGRGSNMTEATRDASGHHDGSSSSRMGAGAGAAAIGTGAGLGAAGASSGNHGGSSGLTSGSRDASGHGAGAGEKGMLSQPQYETGLTNELERRAQQAGTHAAGFGSHGNI
ncbi:hypothetical protein P389DRAFT_171539 [Cystobasidium minutum MCA 4210]|uniref:uncharacterized protein n=1 Tax=Cystobasidium minutum MCA 4210 TaxID=1397322 RepID=UPI0034CEEA5A|eukprot:jgi/Rhomi1/171539/fgenesh1_kg.4_\